MNEDTGKFFDIVNSPPQFNPFGNYGDLMPSMDVFSMGCVIGHLFAENHLFTLSQLLSYKSGTGYSPDDVINRISDEGIRNLVWDMIKVNPSQRRDSDVYLSKSRGTVFPEYFYSILYNFLRCFTVPRSSDRNMVLLYDHYSAIVDKMVEQSYYKQDVDDMTLIVFSLVLSNLRSLKVTHSKLAALRYIIMTNYSVIIL